MRRAWPTLPTAPRSPSTTRRRSNRPALRVRCRELREKNSVRCNSALTPPLRWSPPAPPLSAHLPSPSTLQPRLNVTCMLCVPCSHGGRRHGGSVMRRFVWQCSTSSCSCPQSHSARGGQGAVCNHLENVSVCCTQGMQPDPLANCPRSSGLARQQAVDPLRKCLGRLDVVAACARREGGGVCGEGCARAAGLRGEVP